MNKSKKRFIEVSEKMTELLKGFTEREVVGILELYKSLLIHDAIERAKLVDRIEKNDILPPAKAGGFQ